MSSHAVNYTHKTHADSQLHITASKPAPRCIVKRYPTKKKKNADGVPPRHIYFRFKGEGEGYDSQERVPRKRKTAILCGWTTSVRIILHVRNLNQTYSWNDNVLPFRWNRNRHELTRNRIKKFENSPISRLSCKAIMFQNTKSCFCKKRNLMI